MKVIYWCDLFGDSEIESEILQRQLKEYEIKWDLWETANFPSCLEKKFDVLFFDWGGMSIGNSCMESFCREILNHATEHPSRIYIMTSDMTIRAMEDAKVEYGERIKDITNVFLSLKDAAPLLKG